VSCLGATLQVRSLQLFLLLLLHCLLWFLPYFERWTLDPVDGEARL